MNILQAIAFALVFIGFHLNGNEKTKSISYYIWIVSNAILSMIATFSNLPIIAIMYMGLIVMLLNNLRKMPESMNIFNKPIIKQYRVIQTIRGVGAVYHIERNKLYFEQYETKYTTLKDVSNNVIQFNHKYLAISFVEQMKLKDSEIKNIVG